jgi:transcriptional regulator with XRE-family HTH domain
MGNWPYAKKICVSMVPKFVRTPADLKAARHALGLSADGLARMVRVEDGRTVRRWEAGEREIPGPVTVLMEIAMGYLARKELISQQLQMLKSGKMLSGKTRGNKIMDDTADNIARLSEAQDSLDGALETLTRQPPINGTGKQVHWYHLRRLTPKFEPPQKDDWSLPGELSYDAALAYFEKHEGFNNGLEICDDDDLTAEFVLEKRELLRTQSPSGVSQWLRAGQTIDSILIRPKRK